MPRLDGCAGGWFHTERDGSQPGTSVKCSNKKAKEFQDRCRRVLKTAGIPEPYLRKTFEQFEPEGNEDVVEVVKTWSDKPEGWLFLYGQVGTGKTHLLCAALQAVIMNGHIGFVASLPDILWEAQPSNSGAREMVQDLMDTQILGLDDLGAHRDSPFALEVIFRVINKRYMTALPTIITSNLTVRDMAGMNIDWKRIADRIVEMTRPDRILKLKGESKR